MVPEKLCSIPDCERKHFGRTWCNMHYQRWRKCGSPLGATSSSPSKACSIPECPNSGRIVRGWCSMHYKRWQVSGSTGGPGRLTAQDRFWAKVKKTDACWSWTGSKNIKGYGTLGISGRPLLAHRVSYVWLKGSIPDGMQIDHRCHNPACVNPDHMRLATNKQNGENRNGPTVENKSSGVRGVSWHKGIGKWRASVTHHGVNLSLGYFETIPEAESVVVAKRNELFTHNDRDRIPA